MKKRLTSFLIAISIFLSVNIYAQTFGSPVLVEQPLGIGGNYGQYSSLSVVNGNPAMVYYDETHHNLTYVRATDASGTTWASPIYIDDFGDVGQYASLQIVNGMPAISYVGYAISGSGAKLKYIRALDINGTTWAAPINVDTGFVGLFTSLQMVNGMPAISYNDYTRGDLKYIRATDASGTAWGQPISIDTTGNTGFHTSLQIVNGTPAISYLDGTNYDLKYVRAMDANGSVWAAPSSIATSGNVGWYTTLLVVNGNPAISFWGANNLFYIRSTDASGTAWAAPVTIDYSGGSIWGSASMQIVKGMPAVSYFLANKLKYARATNVSGTAWAAPITVYDTYVGVAGQCVSLKTVNGNPAVSFYDAVGNYNNNGNLKYRRAMDSTGTAWIAKVSIDTVGAVGEYTSLQVVNGMPAISYYSGDVNNGDLKYLRATNASGTTWGASVFIDVPGHVGQFTSLQMVNGKPAISYYDATNGNLKYVRAADAVGTAWATAIPIDVNGDDVGYYTSLKVVNGNPAISYYDNTNGNLKYVRATDIDGTVWAAPISIDVSGDVGMYPSLQIVNGMPAISYYDYTTHDLKYVRAGDANGTTWAAAVSIDVAGDVGEPSSLQIVNGMPAISYYDKTNGDLKYVSASDANGTVWAAPILIDIAGDVGAYSSLQIINGKPAISYHNLTTGDLKYVQAIDISGTAWATPVSIDVTGGVGVFTSLQMVNGAPGISYYDYTHRDLKYKQALDSSGSLWVSQSSFGVAEIVGVHPSLQPVNGMPAISYYDQTNGSHRLKYVRAMDTSGTTWAASVFVDIAGNVGTVNSLRIVNGMPAISYYNMTNGDLKYVRALDANGSIWGTPVSIDVAGDVGSYGSLQIVNGKPAISYYDASNGNLKYVRATDVNGTAWAAPVSIDVFGDVGGHTSLQIVNGNPAISYFDYTHSDLKYVRATDTSGTAWATPIAVDTGNTGWSTSLQPVNGKPAIAYFKVGTNLEIKYVRASDANGTNWATPVSIDFVPNSGSYVFMQMVNGRPAISYFAGGDLKYVRASDPSGTAWNQADVFPHVQPGSISMIPMGTGVCIAYYNAGEKFPYFISGVGAACINSSVPTLSANSTSICTGNSTTLSIASGILNDATAWHWYNGSCGGTSVGSDTTIIVSPDVPTSYYARGEGGCPTQAACQSIQVTVNPLPYVSLGPNVTQCGDTLTLDAGNAGSTYAWSTTATTQTINVTASNTYSVVVTDVNSCSDSATITVTINPLPVVATNLSGVSITANQTGATYQWLNCNNTNFPIPGATNQSYTATANGNYAVIVTMNGCSDTSACVNINIIGVDEIVDNNKLSVYPNPSIGALTIHSTNEGAYSIVNESGQTIQQFELNSRNKYAINIENLSNGIYFIVGFNNNQITNQKVVVAK